jgi:hypothetical protein
MHIDNEKDTKPPQDIQHTLSISFAHSIGRINETFLNETWINYFPIGCIKIGSRKQTAAGQNHRGAAIDSRLLCSLGFPMQRIIIFGFLPWGPS